MAAWADTSWYADRRRSQSNAQIAKAVEPTKEEVRGVLNIISGMDQIQDAPPNSCSGKCQYFTKVTFYRTPWPTGVSTVVFIVTFSIVAIGSMSMREDLDKYGFKPTSTLSIGVLLYAIIVSMLVWFFSLLGSQFCLGRAWSKWGTRCCGLYYLRFFEGLLFVASCVSLLLVGLDSIALIANSCAIASISVVCDVNQVGIPEYTNLMKDDDILSSFLDIKQVPEAIAGPFCDDMSAMRDDMSSWWYANFFAIVSHVVLTIFAYQNYIITQSIYRSTIFGATKELAKELAAKEKEHDAAKERKRQQKQNRKGKKNSVTSVESKKEKRKSGTKEKKWYEEADDDKAPDIGFSNNDSAFASNSNNDSNNDSAFASSNTGASAYGVPDNSKQIEVADDSSSDEVVNDNFIAAKNEHDASKGGAFGGDDEWWK